MKFDNSSIEIYRNLRSRVHTDFDNCLLEGFRYEGIEYFASGCIDAPEQIPSGGMSSKLGLQMLNSREFHTEILPLSTFAKKLISEMLEELNCKNM